MRNRRITRIGRRLNELWWEVHKKVDELRKNIEPPVTEPSLEASLDPKSPGLI